MLINQTCPICKSSHIYVLTNIVRKCKQKDFKVMICDDCHHMFPCRHFSYEEQKDVSEHYISTKTVTSLDYNIDSLRKDNASKINKIEVVYNEILPLLKGNILIIGGGTGYQHNILENYLEVVDPSKFVKNDITDKVDKFSNCTFEDYKTDITFDVVLLQDVVCYFVDPHEIFQKIYDLLNINGSVIIVGGHIVDEFVLDFDDKLIFQFMPSHYFSRQSIKFVLYQFNDIEFFSIDNNRISCVKGTKRLIKQGD
jgi:SAM-dependent methyltransferase